MGADETGEVLGPHDQRMDRLERGHGRGAHVHAQRAALTDELAWTALSDDPGTAALLNSDLRPAAANYHDEVRLLAFLHLRGVAGECPLVRDCGEGLLLGGVRELQKFTMTPPSNAAA